jgi:hypothetical protein
MFYEKKAPGKVLFLIVLKRQFLCVVMMRR